MSRSNSSLKCEGSDVRNTSHLSSTLGYNLCTNTYLSHTSERIRGYACYTQTVLKKVFHGDDIHADNNIANISLQSHALDNKQICMNSLRCTLHQSESACQVNEMSSKCGKAVFAYFDTRQCLAYKLWLMHFFFFFFFLLACIINISVISYPIAKKNNNTYLFFLEVKLH